MSEIVKTDSRARRRAIAIIVVVATVGSGLIASVAYWRDAMQSWLRSDPTETLDRLRLAVSIVTLFICIPVAALAVYLWRFGTTVVSEQRFPPAGLRVIRDVAVLRGRSARIRGRLVKTLAVVLCAATIGVCIAMWRILAVFGKHAL